MKLTADKARWYEDSDGFWLAVRTKDRAAADQAARDIVEKPWDVELKEHREKRSLDANRYAWKLMNELGNVLRSDKDDVYLTMLKRYGQREIVSVRADINVSGYFKYYEEAGSGKVGGVEFTHYKVYKGSSEYDTREMSILVDGIVSECKELGIETMTPAELAALKEEWGRG